MHYHVAQYRPPEYRVTRLYGALVSALQTGEDGEPASSEADAEAELLPDIEVADAGRWSDTQGAGDDVDRVGDDL